MAREAGGRRPMSPRAVQSVLLVLGTDHPRAREFVAIEEAEPEFENSEGDVIARTHEIAPGVKRAKWRTSVTLQYA
jgi:hypothetical protein